MYSVHYYHNNGENLAFNVTLALSLLWVHEHTAGIIITDINIIEPDVRDLSLTGGDKWSTMGGGNTVTTL